MLTATEVKAELDNYVAQLGSDVLLDADALLDMLCEVHEIDVSDPAMAQAVGEWLAARQ